MARKSHSSESFLIVIVGIIALVIWIIQGLLQGISLFLQQYGLIILIIVGVSLLSYTSYLLYVQFYFKSKSFKALKLSVNKFTESYNDLNYHIIELRSAFKGLGVDYRGKSTLTDESNYNFKRSEWTNIARTERVHECSLQIVKNANTQPINYLCKYFDIKPTEEYLNHYEMILNNFSAAEEGKVLLRKEKNQIIDSIKKKVPYLIVTSNKQKLDNKLGFMEDRFDELYFPKYTFQYISAGGNSSSRCDVVLDIDNLNDLIEYLNSKIKFIKSVAGQRALMTSALRMKILERDNYTCQSCSLSTRDEENLLIEIDHKIPVSKGGLTTEENLQALCWKCNRRKGARIEN